MDRVFLKPRPFPLPNGNLYTVEAFLGECVWTYEKWGASDDWIDAQIRIGDLVEATEIGKPIVLSIEDFEKLREAVRAAKLAGSFAHRLRRMGREISSAVPVDSPDGKQRLAPTESLQ